MKPENHFQELTSDLYAFGGLLIVAGVITFAITIAVTEPGRDRRMVAQIASLIALMTTVYVWMKFFLNQ